jgi:hypothetical protein
MLAHGKAAQEQGVRRVVLAKVDADLVEWNCYLFLKMESGNICWGKGGRAYVQFRRDLGVIFKAQISGCRVARHDGEETNSALKGGWAGRGFIRHP